MSTLSRELAGHRHWLDDQRGVTRYLTDFRDDWRPRLATIAYAYDHADFSVTDRTNRRKYVCPTGDPTRPVTPPQMAAGQSDGVTNGERGRIYLDAAIELAGRPWVGYRRDSLAYLRVSDDPHRPTMPAYYRGGHVAGRYCLVDLDRAYWQIASSATADMHVRLPPGGGIVVGDGVIEWPRADELAADKALGQAVIGLMHMTHGTHVRYGRPVEHKVRNRYLGPDLYAYILLTLQAVAFEAVEDWQVPHVCVDSYAVPENRVDDFLGWLWDRWTLRASVRARGAAHYYGYCLYEYTATKYGDRDASTAWVAEARRLTGKPPRVHGRTGTTVGRHDSTRDQLAAKRRWLTERRPDRAALWAPLPQRHPTLDWREALT